MLNRRQILAAFSGAAALSGAAFAAHADDSAARSDDFDMRLRRLDPPQPAPDVAFRNADLSYRGVPDFHGAPLVLTLWATWCGWCAREIPALDRVAAEWGPRGIGFCALSVDHDGRGTPTLERARALVEDFNARRGVRELAIYLDEERLFAAVIGLHGTPTTYFIDPKGRLTASIEGPARWEGAGAQAYLAHLSGAAAAPDPNDARSWA